MTNAEIKKRRMGGTGLAMMRSERDRRRLKNEIGTDRRKRAEKFQKLD